ncbi:MAG: dihydroorotate dehydrogenase electron transfer subunit [Candidatus Marinimicrobia bacterium]|nr:dihydroorotate dehydrogenase electron transfer subunit [Candidatus Neomarinimicrobiota bacterium]
MSEKIRQNSLPEERKFLDAIIERNECIASETYEMVLLPEIDFPPSKPGQFVNLYLKGIFPRPFSIAGRYGEKEFKILYKVIGKNTEYLSGLQKGSRIKIAGPLGHGFEWKEKEYSGFVLVGGGIGVAPLFYLWDSLKNVEAKKYFFAGFKNSSEIVEPDGLGNILLATEDGSAGYKGTVVDLLEEEIEKFSSPLKIFACGPGGLLKKAVTIANRFNHDIEIALETVMACGMGLCQGCVVKYMAEEGEEFRLVCKDGPVFDGKKIIF